MVTGDTLKRAPVRLTTVYLCEKKNIATTRTSNKRYKNTVKENTLFKFTPAQRVYMFTKCLVLCRIPHSLLSDVGAESPYCCCCSSGCRCRPTLKFQLKILNLLSSRPTSNERWLEKPQVLGGIRLGAIRLRQAPLQQYCRRCF